MSVNNYGTGPVRYHKRPSERCNRITGGGRCRRKAVFPSGRCGSCEEAGKRRDFATLDGYLKEAKP